MLFREDRQNDEYDVSMRKAFQSSTGGIFLIITVLVPFLNELIKTWIVFNISSSSTFIQFTIFPKVDTPDCTICMYAPIQCDFLITCLSKKNKINNEATRSTNICYWFCRREFKCDKLINHCCGLRSQQCDTHYFVIFRENFSTVWCRMT